MEKRIIIIITFIAAIFIINVPITYAVPITNANFEKSANGVYNESDYYGIWHNRDITGWQYLSSGAALSTYGIWAPENSLLKLDDGNENYVGYLRNGSISQSLSWVVYENSVYNLGIDIGNRSDQDPFPNYTISLLAGGNVLTSWSDLLTPSDGTLESLILNYALTAEDYKLYGGEELSIMISSSGMQLNFDNVWLENDYSNDVAPVPEPATILLIGSGLLGIAGIRRKRKK